MRQMLDSVTSALIPLGTSIVAGYVDGRYRWTPADWARHNGARQVRIAVFAETDDGLVLDVERGDATPDQAPAWLQRRRAAGENPAVYCSASLVASVRAACSASGVPEPQWWVADWNGRADVMPGAVAHQYASVGPYDISAVADFWPGLDAPTPRGTPYPGRYVMIGSWGPMVVLVQQAVGVRADGMFGPITRGAVVGWQLAHGLSGDGIVGPVTWAALIG
jgi:peptidoglycan hydrolase-like protein with peptidoglycan-binding domain